MASYLADERTHSCDKECQKKDWHRIHKTYCKIYQDNAAETQPAWAKTTDEHAHKLPKVIEANKQAIDAFEKRYNNAWRSTNEICLPHLS